GAEKPQQTRGTHAARATPSTTGSSVLSRTSSIDLSETSWCASRKTDKQAGRRQKAVAEQGYGLSASLGWPQRNGSGSGLCRAFSAPQLTGSGLTFPTHSGRIAAAGGGSGCPRYGSRDASWGRCFVWAGD